MYNLFTQAGRTRYARAGLGEHAFENSDLVLQLADRTIPVSRAQTTVPLMTRGVCRF